MIEQWIADPEPGSVLITVNQRLSRHYAQLHSQAQLRAGRSWWETPVIVPQSAWLRSLHSACIANGTSTHTLLPDLVAAQLWRAAVKQDKASALLLDTGLAARNAQRAWQTSKAWCCKGVSETEVNASDDHRAFARWRRYFEQHCKKNSLIDVASLAEHLQSVILQNPLAIQLPTKILLAGYLLVPPQLKQFLTVLENQGTEVVFVDSNSDDDNNESVHSNSPLAPSDPKATQRVHRLVYHDDDSAFVTIATQAQLLLAENPSLRLGVVVADLAQRRNQVLRSFDSVFFPAANPEEIAKNGRPFDLSIGLPLVEQSIVRAALLFLKLMVKGLDATELSALLLSPYLPGSQKDARNRELLDRQCRNERVRRISFFEFIALQRANTPLRKSLEKIAKKRWDKTGTATQWANHFGTALSSLGWPGKAIDSTEYQTVEVWSACLDDLQLLDNGEKLSAHAGLQLLQQLCTERVFQIETPSTPIQIMGRLESHGLSFDTLWVTGFDSEIWPPVSTPTPFIPIQQQKAAGVPDASPEKRLQIAKKELTLWQRHADDLYLCHAQSRNGTSLSSAAILNELVLDSSIQFAKPDKQTVLQIHQCAEIISIDDPAGPQLAAGAMVKGGARLLENQARCPFKAFALHRLGIQKLEEAGIGLDPRQHGSVFHRAMELFWQQVQSHSQLISYNEDELDAIYVDVINTAIKEYDIAPELRDIQSRFVHKLMTSWVRKCERPRQPFTVVQLEEKMEIDIAGIAITVIIDRVDKLDSGQHVVIDYKTGRNNSIKTWADTRIENPQLPLYAGTNDRVDGVCFAQVFPNQYRFIGTTSEEGMIASVRSPENNLALKHTFENWQQVREHWNESLNMLAGEVRAGHATITPVAKACDYCELSALCRIKKQEVSRDDVSDSPDAQAVESAGGSA